MHVQVTSTKINVHFHPDPLDASVPQPSIRSTSSLASLNTPATQNGDGAASEANEGEDEFGANESAFDEEGILFGDSKFVSRCGTGIIRVIPLR